MNTKQWLALTGLLTLTLSAAPLHAADLGHAREDHVNVRGQASTSAEVITQLQHGEPVIILEEVTLSKTNEPARWYRIALPTNTPVWISAHFIDPTNKTVLPKRLNVRGGPGENFSVIARLNKGDAVKEIRTVNEWVEIEAPTNAHAFVAADLIEPIFTNAAPTTPAALVAKLEPKTEPNLAVEPKPVVTQPEVAKAEPKKVEPAPQDKAAKTESQPAAKPAEPAPVPAEVVTLPPSSGLTPAPAQALPAVETAKKVAATNAPVATPAPVAPQPEVVTNAPAPVVEEKPVRRIVKREGIVRYNFNVQTPSYYSLESEETGKTIDYLVASHPDLSFKLYVGFKVIVSGEEFMDRRWTRTPVIKVETLDLP